MAEDPTYDRLSVREFFALGNDAAARTAALREPRRRREPPPAEPRVSP